MASFSFRLGLSFSLATAFSFASPHLWQVARMGIPTTAKLAENWKLTTQTGITLKLAAVTDSLVGNPDNLWDPEGGLIEAKGPAHGHSILRKTNPSIRRLLFEINGGASSSGSRVNTRPTPESQDVYAFTPSTMSDLSDPKLPNGWPGVGIDGPASGWIAQNANTPVYIVTNLMKSSDVVLGISDGPFASIDSFPNTLGEGPDVGKSIGARDWGTARVVASPLKDGYLPFQTRPAFVEMAIISRFTPRTRQIKILGINANGKVLAASVGSRLDVQAMTLPLIKRWDIKARPYQFALFKNVHFDPDRSPNH